MANFAFKHVWTAAISVAVLGCCITAKMTQENFQEEFHNSYSRETQTLARLQATCSATKGHFFSLHSQVCKACDVHCPNGTNLSDCGEECRTHFLREELKRKTEAQATEMGKILRNLDKKHQDDINGLMTIVVVLFFASIFSSVLSSLLLTYIWTTRKSSPPGHPVQCEEGHNAQYAPCPGNAVYTQPDQANLHEETSPQDDSEDKKEEVIFNHFEGQPAPMCEVNNSQPY